MCNFLINEFYLLTYHALLDVEVIRLHQQRERRSFFPICVHRMGDGISGRDVALHEVYQVLSEIGDYLCGEEPTVKQTFPSISNINSG